jgi:hypothetical protein
LRVVTPSPLASAYSGAPIEASLFAVDSAAIAAKLEANSPSSVTTTASTRLLAIAAKALSNSLGPSALPASIISNFNDVAPACIAGMIGLLTGLFGFERAATRATSGQASLSNSSLFALSSGRKKVDPVRFASGRARLVTMPVAMASPLIAMTMGIVVVACLAARVPGVPWVTAHASELAVIFGNTVRRTRLRPQPRWYLVFA